MQSKYLFHNRKKSQVLCNRVLHSELLTELSSRFSSRDEFLRVETSSEGSDITEIFPKFEFRLVSTCSDPNFCKFLAKIRVGTSFQESGQVRKARTLPKYFRNSKKAYFQNSRKRKFRKKMSNAGPYSAMLFSSTTIIWTNIYLSS